MAAAGNRIPSSETERVADVFAERFRVDPERVMCDFRNGTIEVPVEALAELLGVDPPKTAG